MEIEEIFNKLSRIEQIETTLTVIQRQLADKREEEIGGLAMAMQITGLSKHRIYQLVSSDIIPHHKVEGVARLFFSRKELTDWILNKK